MPGLLALHAFVLDADGLEVVRGPYLQQGTSTSLIIQWRTDAATDSRIRYGTSLDQLDLTVTDPALVIDHAVSLTGLQPGTLYYYEMGSAEGWIPGDATQSFLTAPPPGAPVSTRIWVLGDSGTANASAAAVRDAYAQHSATRRTDLWIMLGDNAYNNGTDAEYQAAVFDMYPSFLKSSVLWPAIGNHDTAQATSIPASLPYLRIFTLPTAGEAGGLASGTEKYYAFDHANIHFVCLDSMTSDRSPGGPMLTWLRNDLAAVTVPWIIAFWHHPPYTKGSHDSDAESQLIEMRQNALPILEAAGVDLVLAGHSHSYERSYLLKGHYGNSGSLTPAMKVDGGSGRESGDGAYQKPSSGGDGSVYITAGSSGKISGGSLNHPAMFISLNQLGSLVVDVNQDRMDVAFLKADQSIGDAFTLLKAPPATDPPAAPASLTATAEGGSQIRLEWTDQATNESGFLIERSLDGASYAQIGTAGVNATSRLDTDLAPLTTYFYRIRAFNTAGDSAWSHPAQATTLAAAITAELVPAGSDWRYLDDGSDQGTAWRLAAFSDSGWASGPAPLGYGDGDEATVIGYGPDSADKYVTTWFRRSFFLADPSLYTNLFMEVVRDDGVLVHLNGTEVFRSNMPAGPIHYLTHASSAIGGSGESTFLPVNLSPSQLVAGTNQLAVELHQANGTSSDLSFDFRLTATAPPGGIIPPLPPTNLMAVAEGSDRIRLTWMDASEDEDGFVLERSPDGELFLGLASLGSGTTEFLDTNLEGGTTYHYRVRALNGGGPSPWSNTAQATTAPGTFVMRLVQTGWKWKYLDDGSDPGPSWSDTDYDDSTWAVGPSPLGYGDGDEATQVDYGNDPGAKHITTWFRASFTLAPAPTVFTNLFLEVQRDDGVVVYLNGVEVFRDNLPAGSVDAQTPALGAIGGGSESVFLTANLDPVLMVTGTNVLAAEIHQSGPASSDISFDLKLTAQAPYEQARPSAPSNFRLVP